MESECKRKPPLAHTDPAHPWAEWDPLSSVPTTETQVQVRISAAGGSFGVRTGAPETCGIELI